MLPSNKHIKNRFTSLRWTSLTVGLLCGRYALIGNWNL